MLFLAVFCGFIAENQREHYVEHQREKQFMRSLVEDLETDTTELHNAISRADSTAVYSDSTLFFLSQYSPGAGVSTKLAEYITVAGQRLILINTDRTATQLKNSGAMRLVREKEVANAIMRYWKQIEQTNINLDRYLVYRNAGREICFKLWVIPELYKRLATDSISELRVIDRDRKKWDELANLIAISGQIARQGYKNNLCRQLQSGRELIALIKDEYHFR